MREQTEIIRKQIKKNTEKLEHYEKKVKAMKVFIKRLEKALENDHPVKDSAKETD